MLQLRTLRERAGLSAEKLARRADVSLFTVLNIEQGRSHPLWKTVQKLARALGVSPEQVTEEAEEGEARPLAWSGGVRWKLDSIGVGDTLCSLVLTGFQMDQSARRLLTGTKERQVQSQHETTDERKGEANRREPDCRARADRVAIERLSIVKSF